jgi:glucan phosphoethanolaminetransferase (alkaline phosphatase superfamily)
MKVREPMAAGLACLGIVLAAIAAAAWTAITGQIVRQGIDALFLILVCLLVAAAFAPIALQALREFRKSKGGGGQ